MLLPGIVSDFFSSKGAQLHCPLSFPNYCTLPNIKANFWAAPHSTSHLVYYLFWQILTSQINCEHHNYMHPLKNLFYISFWMLKHLCWFILSWIQFHTHLQQNLKTLYFYVIISNNLEFVQWHKNYLGNINYYYHNSLDSLLHYFAGKYNEIQVYC